MTGPRAADSPDALEDPDLEQALGSLSGYATSSADGALAALQRVLQLAQTPQEPILGRYLLERELGRGGMGVVWLARDERLKRQVAVKQLTTPASDSLLRLGREAQAIAQISHPNVVAVFDISLTLQPTCIVMEYVRGKTLRQHLQQRPTLPWGDVVDIYAQAGRGLAAAHALDLVHRDFKPDNAMIDDAGVVKVLDFGLAKARQTPPSAESPAEDDATLTLTGAILGTPAYMSPQQHAGAVAEPSDDVFALGVALWEALYRSLPFRSPGAKNLAAEKRAGPPSPPADSSVPTWLHEVVSRALAPSPEQRWRSMSALVAALDERDRPTRRRQGWTVAALALASLVLIATRANLDQWGTSDEPEPEGRGVPDPEATAAKHGPELATLQHYTHESHEALSRGHELGAELEVKLRRAEEIGHGPTIAGLLLLRSRARRSLSHEERQAMLERAIVLAEGSGDDDTAMRSAAALAELLHRAEYSLEVSEKWIHHGYSIGERTSQIEDGHLDLVNAHALLLIESNDRHEALEVIEDALPRIPLDASPTLVLRMRARHASALNGLGRPREAAEIFSKILEDGRSRGASDSRLIDDYGNLGVCLQRAGEVDAAIAAFEEQLERLRSSPELADRIFHTINISRGLTARPRTRAIAVELLRSVIDEAKLGTSGHARASYSLAGAYEEKGELADAAEAYLTARLSIDLAFGPDSAFARDVAVRIRDLGSPDSLADE